MNTPTRCKTRLADLFGAALSRSLYITVTAAALALGAVVRAGPPQAQAALNRTDADGRLRTDTLRVWPGDGDRSLLSEAGSRRCWKLPLDGPIRYIYVRTLPSGFHGGSSRVQVTIDALDSSGRLFVEYDSYLFPYKSQGIAMSNTGTWRTFEFELPDAGFFGRCNGADFRITADQPVCVAQLRVRQLERALEADAFAHDWSIADPGRVHRDRIGFSHGGVYWGKGGMTEPVYERELDLVRRLGFGWIRKWSEWADVEPQPGVFDWPRLDYRVAMGKRCGLKQLGMVGFCTEWAADAPPDLEGFARTKYPPRDLNDLRRYVRAMVARYKDDVKYWEGWNEANVAGFWNLPPSGRDRFEHYVVWQRAFHAAAKQADPDCTVLTGGFAGEAQLAQHLVRYYEAGMKDTFDVMNIHVYGADPRGNWTPQLTESVIRVMRHYGDADKPIWITETGWPVESQHPYVRALEEQAQWTPWLFTVLLSYPQVERVFFHELRDLSSDANFGWYRRDFSARPVVERWCRWRGIPVPEP